MEGRNPSPKEGFLRLQGLPLFAPTIFRRKNLTKEGKRGIINLYDFRKEDLSVIRSMTGFGRCRETVGGRDITVEIKSVNSRFLDCSVRVSRSVSFLEERVKPYLQARGLTRGKVDVSITVDTVESTDAVALDDGRVKAYLAALRRLRDEYGLRDDISVMSVAGNNDLFVTVKPEEDEERDWAEVEPVLGRAADAFFAAKEREGAALVADLGGKVADMRALAERIGEMSADTVKHYRERLAERVRDALADNHISSDESRILTECAIFADKVAVDEELVRLRTHLDAMEEILRGGDAVGRRLDFLIQEMNREVNTTGSKCTDAAVAQTVVDLKCTLEKVREQIQNLE